MVLSRLPAPSLLGLFGSFLILSPELLFERPQGLTALPFTDPGVQKALAFAVEQYNEDIGCRNYFKELRLQQAYRQGDTRDEYYLKVAVVQTACKKKHGRRMKYERIQRCQLRPRNPQKLICYFKVNPHIPSNKILLTTIACTLVAPSKDLFCSS